MFATSLKQGCIMLVLASQTTIILGQQGLNDYGPLNGDYYRPVPPLPPDFHFTYHHASTAAEGWLRGEAALLHARGNYWLSLSQAFICREQARWLALDNHRRWVEYRLWLRAWHESDRQRRIEARRVENAARRRNTLGVYLLRADEFDRVTGRITWPQLLLAEEHETLREQVNTLFAVRARYASQAVEAECDRCVERLIRKLRRSFGKLDRSDYLAAQDFLRGLKFEGEINAVIN